MKKLRVYIAGPLTAGDRMANIKQAILAGDAVLKAGHIPFIPHLNSFWEMLCYNSPDTWLEWDFAWLHLCDCLIRLPGYSPGSDRETAEASKRDMLLFTLNEFLRFARVMAESERETEDGGNV